MMRRGWNPLPLQLHSVGWINDLKTKKESRMKASEEEEERKLKKGNDMKNIRKQWTVSILPSSFHSCPFFSFFLHRRLNFFLTFFASFFVSSQAISSYSLSLSFSLSLTLSHTQQQIERESVMEREKRCKRRFIRVFRRRDTYFGKKEAMKPTARKKVERKILEK